MAGVANPRAAKLRSNLSISTPGVRGERSPESSGVRSKDRNLDFASPAGMYVLMDRRRTESPLREGAGLDTTGLSGAACIAKADWLVRSGLLRTPAL
jgi:hypothetical protein